MRGESRERERTAKQDLHQMRKALPRKDGILPPQRSLSVCYRMSAIYKSRLETCAHLCVSWAHSQPSSVVERLHSRLCNSCGPSRLRTIHFFFFAIMTLGRRGAIFLTRNTTFSMCCSFNSPKLNDMTDIILK